jgi:hypothetical protein
MEHSKQNISPGRRRYVKGFQVIDGGLSNSRASIVDGGEHHADRLGVADRRDEPVVLGFDVKRDKAE